MVKYESVSLWKRKFRSQDVGREFRGYYGPRSSEAILQSITEQNGLKLSDYSVDMQNNASNGERQGKNEKDNNLLDSSRYSDKEVASDDILTNSETSHSLNLLA